MVRTERSSASGKGQQRRTAKRFRQIRRPKSAVVGVAVTAIVAVGSLATYTVALPERQAAADPAGVLTLAGRAAAKQPDTVPRADQYWYVAEGDGYQAWLSMDGRHDGLVISHGQQIPVPGCRNGMHPNVPVNPQQQVPCVVDPAYLADAPSGTSAMKAYLLKRTNGDTDPNKVGGEVMSMLQFRYLRPAARAALFHVAATLPGLQVQTPGSMGLSANQVAVGWKRQGGTNSIVFDSRTHGFVGIVTGSAAGFGRAAPTFGVVSHVGDLP